MTMIQGMLQELEHEAATTRRVLERVPSDKLAWRPQARARTLGQLAFHIATVPAGVAELAATSPAEEPHFAEEPTPASTADLVPTLDRSVAHARAVLGSLDDAALTSTWRLMRGSRELLAMPRVQFLRAVLLNHWYHHRGQLTVYLRELGVAIPSIYGPSADENPFA
ncbi:MAG TPA: DinB family protein [Vicinamibacterales bacterium]|nr:DinB family protein [Vicinamibacterales bacterium]